MTLVVEADASVKDDVAGLGWVIKRMHAHNDYDVLEQGCTRLLEDESDIDFNHTGRLEYKAVINAVRAATDYGTDDIIVFTDCEQVARNIRFKRHITDGSYHHALMSFLGRFDHWQVSDKDREANTAAHLMATAARVA